VASGHGGVLYRNDFSVIIIIILANFGLEFQRELGALEPWR